MNDEIQEMLVHIHEKLKSVECCLDQAEHTGDKIGLEQVADHAEMIARNAQALSRRAARFRSNYRGWQGPIAVSA